jgi:hypothetical protein
MRIKRSRSQPASVDEQYRRPFLLLGANPRDTHQLALARESVDIERELASMPGGLRFEARLAVSVDDAMRYMTELDPIGVQFSGHCGMDGTAGLEDDHGELQPVTAPALAKMIKAAAPRARVAVINACFGLADAAALLSAVECVVGCDGPISDVAARAFAVRFYAALAAGRSIGNAVAHGTATLVARRLGTALPRCVTREGVEADAIMLVRHARGRRRPA